MNYYNCLYQIYGDLDLIDGNYDQISGVILLKHGDIDLYIGFSKYLPGIESIL